MGAAVHPDPQTIGFVVARATHWRQKRYQDDDRYRHYTETAMAEQVCGEPRPAEDLGDGWWLVGRLVDVIAGQELAIECCPDERKIRLRRNIDQPIEEPPATSFRPAEAPTVRRFPPVSEWNREYEQWREWQE